MGLSEKGNRALLLDMPLIYYHISEIWDDVIADMDKKRRSIKEQQELAARLGLTKQK